MKELTFLGLGGALNFEMGHNSAVYKADDKLLIIDAGEGAIEKLVKMGAFKGVKEVYIAITHLHGDHAAGLSTIIWTSSFKYGINPKIISNSIDFKRDLETFLQLGGVNSKFFSLVHSSQFKINDLTIRPMKTNHDENMQCFGFMFSDKEGQYYYSGDTNDIDRIRKFNSDNNIKRIYCEVANVGWGHIKYNDLLPLNRDKISLMHFSDAQLAKQAQEDGFTIPKCVVNWRESQNPFVNDGNGQE